MPTKMTTGRKGRARSPSKAVDKKLENARASIPDETKFGKGTKSNNFRYPIEHTRIHIDELEKLILVELLPESRAATRLVEMAKNGEIPHISYQRGQRLYRRCIEEWSQGSAEKRKHDFEKNLRSLEELIMICRNGRKDPKDPSKWITRPSVHAEIQARIELHRILGMYSPTPIVSFNFGSGIGTAFASAPPEMLAQLARGHVPYLEPGTSDEDAIVTPAEEATE